MRDLSEIIIDVKSNVLIMSLKALIIIFVLLYWTYVETNMMFYFLIHKIRRVKIEITVLSLNSSLIFTICQTYIQFFKVINEINLQSMIISLIKLLYQYDNVLHIIITNNCYKNHYDSLPL